MEEIRSKIKSNDGSGWADKKPSLRILIISFIITQLISNILSDFVLKNLSLDELFSYSQHWNP